MIVVFDLDGTLCDNSQREHIAHGAAGKVGAEADAVWDAFHERILDDVPIEPIKAVLLSLADRNTIQIWTARSVKWEKLTCEWLNAYSVPYDRLRMRDDDDQRKAYIIKLEWYLTSTQRPELVFEDHPETTRLLRLAGAVVAQVGEGHKN